MNIKRYVTKERLIFIALLLFITAVVIYAPLHYGFIYPTGGDDTAHHIRYLQNLIEDFSYIGDMGYYGMVMLLPFTLLGMEPITVFSVFNYVVIIAVFVSMWVLIRRFYGLLPAVFSFYISVFVVMSTWYYFEDGTIFNIFNMWVIAPLAYYAMCRWLQEDRKRWLVTAGVLFVITSLVHSATYLYIMAAVVLFSAVFAFWQYRKKNHEMLKRTIIFTGVFCLSILTALATWMHKLLPNQVQHMAGTITGEEVAYAARVTLFTWVRDYLNPYTLLIMATAVFIMVILSRKGNNQEVKQIYQNIDQPLTYLIISFLFILTVGTFTKLGYNYDRFGRELATFTGLGIAILLGVGLAHYRLSYNRAWIAIVAVLFVISNAPVHNWLSDYTALRSCDREAIEYLDELAAEPVTVQHFVKTAPWIYSLYSSNNISYQRVYDFSELELGAVVIYRNNHMTFYTDKVAKEDKAEVTIAALASRENLAKLAVFTSGEDMIIIYKVEAP